ncbi:MAG: UDP-N-acetylmuramate dehydrogenase [Clostridia bacterium]|nr:UDP-N-acetylmuramate dehydrogenase [Clostridia bacterium]
MSIEQIAVSAASVSSLRCGGEIRRACFPRGVKDLREVYESCGDEVIFLGGLTNTLVTDEGVDEVALFSDRLKGLSVEGETLVAGAGEKLVKVVRYAAKCGLSGLEGLANVPGSIGGAVRGNAGAYGAEISDFLSGVDVFRFDVGQPEYLSREEIAFSYRYSNLNAREYVVRAYFSLKRDSVTEIAERMKNFGKKRSASQPKEPSLGSVFKRHEGTSMGWYIERCGLKGEKKGAFSFSVRHAGFIVNDALCDGAEARAEDYLYLVRLAEKRIYEEFGIRPKREVNVIGDKRQERNWR